MQKLQQHALKIFQAGVQAVAPNKLVLNALKVSSDKLLVENKEYHLDHNVHVVAFGKAVVGMLQAVESVLGNHIVHGVASVPDYLVPQTTKETTQTASTRSEKMYQNIRIDKIEIMEGAKNNYPDERAQKAAAKIMDIAENVGKNDILLVLISGGGSALLPLPVPEITLHEKLETTKILSNKGATIVELNTVRKHLSRIKGGKLAQAAYPASVITLILSDVLGDPMDIIACGPTVLDMSTKKDCLEIVEKLNARDNLPRNVLKYLNSSSTSNKNLDFSHVNNIIVGNNIMAVDGATLMARELGYVAIIHSTHVSGAARDVGKLYAELAVSSKERARYFQDFDSNKRVCILGAGETTVVVRGSGQGGRNQELALAAAIEMNELRCERHCILLSAGTDGEDGPTQAAGAYAFPTLVTSAATQGLDAKTYLERNDSFSFYSRFENGRYLVNTGLTGTNVMDLQVLLLS